MNNILATGRRKKSSARVFFKPGKGLITINGKALADYFPNPFNQQFIKAPFVTTSQQDKYDVTVTVKGGGFTGHKEAVRLGIARALLLVDTEFKKPLRGAGFLTRDGRDKERKKPGKKGARGGHTFTKR